MRGETERRVVRRVAVLLGLLAVGCVHRATDFPPDFKTPVSNQTGAAVKGWGGDGGGVSRTPVIFVHGNTVTADFWDPAREYFKERGYSGDELWAPGYGWNSSYAFDSNDLSVPTLDAFIDEVQRELQRKTGRRIPQFDIVAHSLGVTLVRQWMKQNNAYHRVRNFVAVSGGNHGVYTAAADARGQNRVIAFELYPDSPWLAQLNRGGETPGMTRTLTLYDGSGWNDVFFPRPLQDSPALQGATNLAWDREHLAWYDHMELPRKPKTLEAMIEFLRAAGEPLPAATPPNVLRSGNRLRADAADAELRCAGDGELPGRATLPAREVELRSGLLLTCFAHSERSGLSGPMARYAWRDAAARSAEPLTLAAEPAAGVYEQPQQISLKASDAQAYIVYTTSGREPDSGSPLYTQPVYVAAPLTLIARAIAPDGRMSAPLRLSYDISLEWVEAQHSLQRQLDPKVAPDYAGRRKKGN